MTIAEFEVLLQTIADGWNTGDAQKAVDCFTDGAEYMEPPNKQLIIGKEKLYPYFGGGKLPKKMHLVWHNIMFNEKTQVGSGEFTFVMDSKNHGVVVVELSEGKIRKWREYQWTGDLNYEEFLDPNKKFEYTGEDLI